MQGDTLPSCCHLHVENENAFRTFSTDINAFADLCRPPIRSRLNIAPPSSSRALLPSPKRTQCRCRSIYDRPDATNTAACGRISTATMTFNSSSSMFPFCLRGYMSLASFVLYANGVLTIRDLRKPQIQGHSLPSSSFPFF